MSLTSLYLAPIAARSAPQREAIERVLSQLEIVGARISHSTFLAGTAFARHVIYAGCSPHLIMQPPADGSLQFCHVVVHGPFSQPRLITGPNTVKPRCPACRARFDDWKRNLEKWTVANATVPCGQCGAINSVADLDWRQHAIVARVLVELRNVFPGEASPGDALMTRLEQATGEPWRYAWAGLLAVPATT